MHRQKEGKTNENDCNKYVSEEKHKKIFGYGFLFVKDKHMRFRVKYFKFYPHKSSLLGQFNNYHLRPVKRY